MIEVCSLLFCETGRPTEGSDGPALAIIIGIVVAAVLLILIIIVIIIIVVCVRKRRDKRPNGELF